jgi:hypothetical protein
MTMAIPLNAGGSAVIRTAPQSTVRTDGVARPPSLATQKLSINSDAAISPKIAWPPTDAAKSFRLQVSRFEPGCE